MAKASAAVKEQQTQAASAVKRQRIKLQPISVLDFRLKGNKWDAGVGEFFRKPGIHVSGKDVVISPAQLQPESKTATLILRSQDLIELVSRVPLHIPTESDSASVMLPSIGQRNPTRGRRKAIVKSWKNKLVTPEGYTERVELTVYNCRITPGGIVVPADGSGIICVDDGGGRLDTVFEELVDVGSLDQMEIFKRKISWLVQLDLHGDPVRAAQRFLKGNCDPKKTRTATELGVRATIVSANPDCEFDSAGEAFAAEWVVKEMTEKFYSPESVITLFTWRNEAGSCTSDKVKGGGEVSSIRTAIKSLAAEIDQAGIAVDELPAALDFVFRCFYKACPLAYKDSTAGGKGTFHIDSTLAIKVMALMMTQFYTFSNGHEETFIKLVNQAFKQHYTLYKPGYDNSRARNVDADRFFQLSKSFNCGNFNSGRAATGDILKELKAACNIVRDKNKIAV